MNRDVIADRLISALEDFDASLLATEQLVALTVLLEAINDAHATAPVFELIPGGA